MPTAYENEKARVSNVVLRAQVEIAVAHAAVFVMAGGSVNNRQHEANAENAVQNPVGHIEKFIYIVIRDATVAANFPNQTDAQVQAVIDAQWPRVWK